MSTTNAPKQVESPDTICYGIQRDGLLPGFLPAFTIVTVTVDSKGKSTVQRSKVRYLLAEAQAIVEDKIRMGLSL